MDYVIKYTEVETTEIPLKKKTILFRGKIKQIKSKCLKRLI